jgi:hypothetical protein
LAAQTGYPLQVRTRQPQKHSHNKASAGRFLIPCFLRFSPLRAFHCYPWQGHYNIEKPNSILQISLRRATVRLYQKKNKPFTINLKLET